MAAMAIDDTTLLIDDNDTLPDGGHPITKKTFFCKKGAEEVSFTLDAKYTVDKYLGNGAYGIVGKGLNTATGDVCAIKKMHGLFHDAIPAKRALRELKIQAMLCHDNILRLFDIMTIDLAEKETFTEMYLVCELMDTDLHRIIQSAQPLTEAHFKLFIYQLFRGLKYLHSANVIHRDIKPANCLVNRDATLKICDFGLAKIEVEARDEKLTPYVVTRWYRAPELLLEGGHNCSYTTAVDMWAAGMVLAELLGRKPFLKGRHSLEQLKLTFNLLGPPPEDTLARLGEKKRTLLRDYAYPPHKEWREYFPGASDEALDLLDRLLRFDPAERLTAEQALKHPYVAQYHDVNKEPICEQPFIQFDFERKQMSVPIIRRLIFNEMLRFHPDLGDYIPSTPEQAFPLSQEELAEMDLEEPATLSSTFESMDSS